MLRRTHLIRLVAGAALLVASCGNGPEPAADVNAGPTTTTDTPTTSTTPPSSTTTATTTTTKTTTTATTTTTTTTTTAPPVIESDVDAVYSPVSVPAGSLVVHDRSSVYVVDLTLDPIEPQIVLGPLDGLVILVARMATDGSLVVEVIEDVPIGQAARVDKIVQFGPNGSIIDLIEDSVLFDVAPFGGVEQALVGEFWDGNIDDGASLVAVPLDGRPPVAFGTAFAPEYGVGSIDVVHGVAVVSAFADLTELVTFTDADGSDISRPSPTDGLAYGEAPFVVDATFSPDGSQVAWIEGPEHYVGGESDEPTWHGEWRIRSFDAASGEEVISWPFEFPNPDPFTQVINGLAHTGDRLVISRGQVHDGPVLDLELLILDLTGEEPELYEVPVFGVADVIR